jgi:hypothetical protein
MFTFDMKKDNFTILNLTDMQLNECHYDPNDPEYDNSYDIMDYTIKTLIDRVKPELITITGDLSMADQPKAYPQFADYMDQFGIPWCAVWGNHDQQDPEERIQFVYKILPYYRSKKFFFHEDGDPSLGNGNYLIAIQKDGKPVHVLFMIDSHNCVWIPDENGVKHFYYDKLTEAQIEWYKEQAANVKEMGVKHSSMLMHIPMHAYQDAYLAAFKPDIDTTKVTVEESYGTSCWNPGYEESFGVKHEAGDIACYPFDDGVFSAIKEMDITDNVISGHVHLDNTVIPYQGVRLAFALKTGKVHPWTHVLNGGTVISVNKDGSSELKHEYVDVTHLMTPEDFE